MPGKLFVAGVVLCFSLLSTPGKGETIESERLIIRDATGSISFEKLGNLSRKVESTLTEVMQFWSADPRVDMFGKIIVEFDRQLPGAATSVFMWRQEKSARTRVVRVFGGHEAPHLLAHKLTSALFPNPDKLVRNMMGEASEMRFGNPLSFPMCGFKQDEWVLAFLQAGSYIPLAKIGPSHSDWGMEIHNGVPAVSDRVKQHTSYAEAGSFGAFLINTYGTEKMKQFNQFSRKKSRPWQEVYGSPLEGLETRWLETLKSQIREKQGVTSQLVSLLKSNPAGACSEAQNIAGKK